MTHSIEFTFEYDNKDQQYYVINYSVNKGDKIERTTLLKRIKSLGLVSVTAQPNKELANLLAKELNVNSSAFKFTVKY